MVRHREQIEAPHGGHPPARLAHQAEVATQRGGVAGHVGDRPRGEVEDASEHLGTRAAARRVEHHEVDRVQLGPAQPGRDRALVDPHARQVVEVAPRVGAGPGRGLDGVDLTVLPERRSEAAGEQADAHLKLLALRQTREQYVASLLGIPDSELTLGGRKAIARWYEVYGYDDAMVQEAAVQAGPKRDLWYWNSILKTWNAKGLRNIHDVRTPVAAAGASRNIRVDRETPSGNDFLKNAARRRPLRKKTDTPAE